MRWMLHASAEIRAATCLVSASAAFFDWIVKQDSQATDLLACGRASGLARSFARIGRTSLAVIRLAESSACEAGRHA